jgi:hypothetical protein
MSRWWAAALGSFIVVLTLREVYRDLFHPTATGSLSDFVAKATFGVFRRFPKFLTDAGPLAIALVILIWALSVSFGFALIYWSVPPEFFALDAGDPRAGLLAMMYFSLGVLATMGLADYTPLPVWLRLLITAEALIGFAVLSASVSSIILIQQAVARMRTLARKLSVIARTQEEYGFSFCCQSDGILTELSAEILRTRVDLVQLPVVYYFYADREQSSLPMWLPTALQLAREAISEKESLATERAGALLMVALRDLAEVLRIRFVEADSDDCEVVFKAYADHHSPAK